MRASSLVLSTALWVVALMVCGCPTGQSVVGGRLDATVTDDVTEDRVSTDDREVATVDTVPSPDLPSGLDATDVADVAEDRGTVRCVSNAECANRDPSLTVCELTTGRCVQCVAAADTCPATQHCDAATNRCVDGCRSDDGCTMNAATPRCLVAMHTCVACVTDEHCAAGLRCTDNRCVEGCSPTRACPGGATCCSDRCVDTSTSTTHCGACGRVCNVANATAACTMGTCGVGECNTGYGDCDRMASNGCEAELNTSVMHCGACGSACRPANATGACAMGMCTVRMCNTGFGDCDGNANNGCEVDLTTSSTHCGSCRNACGVGMGCTAGTCTATCAPGQRLCGEVCVDTNANTAHCGSCGTTCPMRPNATPTCTRGTCGFTCNTGFADCDESPMNGCEVDLRSSAMHCGACGRRCAPANATGVCSAGMCSVGACNPGFADCDGNAANGCEVDTRTSSSHCGACGNRCAPANATGVCSAGMCSVGACNPGFADCDGNAANGCEIDTRTSPSHCGACGRTCSLANATSTCVMGMCAVGTCNPGFADCDGNATNGCEVNTTLNDMHCGRCANACARGASCTAGMCECPLGTMMCSGACIVLTADPMNCGRCGNVCPMGQVCVAGTCVPSCAAGTTLCAGRCVLLGADREHCGRCGNACPAEHICSGGVCTPVVTISAIGCADGQREAFTDMSRFPNIAACSGGWTLQGIFPAPSRSGVAACTNAGDDNTSNPNGMGCSSADLCAQGWHICRGGEVTPRAPMGCASTSFYPPGTFYAAAVSGTGCGVCALLTGTVTMGCNSSNCLPNCREDSTLNNDFFGCGVIGAPVSPTSCDGLSQFSNNNCGSLTAPWVCGGSVTESLTVTKPGAEAGGVLCCR